MAQRGQKDLLMRLADAGEEALTRLASSPGMERVTGAVTNLKDQVDALASKVRGMDALEKRIEELERKVERLSKSSGSSSRKTSTTRKTSSSRKTASSKKS
jgi:polyhydroxyalkanoate synthesis regulator phasin